MPCWILLRQDVIEVRVQFHGVVPLRSLVSRPSCVDVPKGLGVVGNQVVRPNPRKGPYNSLIHMKSIGLHMHDKSIGRRGIMAYHTFDIQPSIRGSCDPIWRFGPSNTRRKKRAKDH